MEPVNAFISICPRTSKAIWISAKTSANTLVGAQDILEVGLDFGYIQIFYSFIVLK